KVGDSIKKVGDVLQPGNVVLTEPVEPEKGDKKSDVTRYTLNQIPKVEGALVAIDPHTGRVLALSGGYSFEKSQFDRAIQAKRQPGSAFKPFVYLAGLENGLSPNTIILDAPFVIDQGPGLPKWRPGNYSDRFYGPSTMRLGIEKSRNLMTVRLAQKIGMEHVAEVARRFGIIPDLQEVLAMSLGAGETTLMNLTTAYAMLVNGGKRIEPTLIDRIQNRNGVTVFRHDARPCPGCNAEDWRNQPVPQVPDTRDSVGDPAAIYQIVSMLEGVVQRGTGRRIASIGKPLAGKTGTTNNSQDAWFVGFSPDLAVGAFVGFDEPKGLGNKETGSSVAAPVFKSFMEGALAGQPGIPFRVPPGIRLVRVNASTGLPARAGDSDVILEAFRPGNEPNERNVIDGNTDEGNWTDGPAAEVPTLTGTGGLY
ncbi:MAG: penicillin-binding protein 1A, partial [Rhodospirillales bacterium]